MDELDLYADLKKHYTLLIKNLTLLYKNLNLLIITWSHNYIISGISRGSPQYVCGYLPLFIFAVQVSTNCRTCICGLPHMYLRITYVVCLRKSVNNL